MMTLDCVAHLFSVIFNDDNISLQKRLNLFRQWMQGQTVSCIGNETLYYLNDVTRFIAKKPVID